MRQVIEILAQVSGPDFVAGIVLVDDRVTKAAPILRFMRGWSRDRVRTFCLESNWNIRVVWQKQSTRRGKPPLSGDRIMTKRKPPEVSMVGDGFPQPCPFCGGRGLTSHPDAYEQEDCAACDGTGEMALVENAKAP